MLEVVPDDKVRSRDAQRERCVLPRPAELTLGPALRLVGAGYVIPIRTGCPLERLRSPEHEKQRFPRIADGNDETDGPAGALQSRVSSRADLASLRALRFGSPPESWRRRKVGPFGFESSARRAGDDLEARDQSKEHEQ